MDDQDGDVDMGVVHDMSLPMGMDKKNRKEGCGKRGQRTTKQKKKKKKNVEKALAVAERIQTKVKKLGAKVAKKKSAKTLWEK